MDVRPAWLPQPDDADHALVGLYLISMYYKRYELQWRVSLFFSASILAGAFSGLLAYAINNMNGVAGYHGWRWIFIM